MGKKPIRFSDQVREAVVECKLTRHRICLETGIDEGYFSRFMARKEGLGMKYLDGVAKLLRLDLAGFKQGKKYVKLSDQVRQAVLATGMTRSAISRATGVGHETLTGFLRGRKGLRLAPLDALAEWLGLTLVQTGTPPSFPRGKVGRPRKIQT
jgi:hypothetical protein